MLQSLQILGPWHCLPGKLYNLEIATAIFWEGMFHHSWIPSFLQQWVQPTELLHDLPCIQILRQKCVEVCLRQHCVMETTKAIQTIWKHIVVILFILYIQYTVYIFHGSKSLGRSIVKKHKPSGSHNWQSTGGAKGAAHLATHLKIEDQPNHQYSSGWWFEPIWKISVKMGIFPK